MADTSSGVITRLAATLVSGFLFVAGIAIARVATAQSTTRTATFRAALPWTEHTIASKRLGEPRRIRVAKPRGYDAESRKYPVLLLLDADDELQFRAAIANIEFLTDRKAIPPMLLVGVVNDKNRTRDLTPLPTPATKRQAATAGGVDRFLDFIEQEVIPSVSGKYRSASYRVLAGHSFGGLAGLWTAAHRPALADAVVAISPSLWFNELELIAPLADAIAARTSPLRLFTSRGGVEPSIDSSEQRFAVRLDSLLQRQSQVVHYAHRQYGDQPHPMTPLVGLIDGVRAIFADYSMAPSNLDRIVDRAALDSAQWVAQLSMFEDQWARSIEAFPRGRLGEPDSLDRTLPEAFFPEVLRVAQYDRGTGSLAWARRAVALRPRSPGAHRTLGQVLVIRGDSLQARAAFQRALVLARTALDSAATRRASGKLLGNR